ncbi:MAG TPA: VOC family protein, partial [Blastocatellia bacterium]|nr:VOC family protein [Blastocatellia bacterium]
MKMIEGARYVHTNLIARDWRSLAQFYEELFGCVVVPPERDYAGAALEAGTGIQGASLKGVHLRLPGYDANGPTLEIFTYSELTEGQEPKVNRPGYGHIAFEVDSVIDARQQVLAAGGTAIGEIICS